MTLLRSFVARLNAHFTVTAATIGCIYGAISVFGCAEDKTEPAGDSASDAGPTGPGPGTGDASKPPADIPFMSGADAGCPLKFAGPSPGTVAVSVPRAGTNGSVAWEKPENGRAIDSQLARAVLNDGQETELLRVTGYGFDLPPKVTIKGVVVQLKRRGQNAVVDGAIELWLGAGPTERPKFIAKSAWPREVGTHHYGQEVDTWGNDLTPAMFSTPAFGTQIYAKRGADAGTDPIVAEVESLLITVWYCD